MIIFMFWITELLNGVLNNKIVHHTINNSELILFNIPYRIPNTVIDCVCVLSYNKFGMLLKASSDRPEGFLLLIQGRYDRVACDVGKDSSPV